MKVLGISGSGRAKGYSAQAVKDLLGELEVQWDFVSLSGLKINGCIGCLGCSADNICVQKDDYQMVINKALEADAIVFAGPNYYGTLGAIASAFWERTFSLRHREAFPLAGKLGIAIGFDRAESAPAKEHILKMMQSNKMAVIDSFSEPGHYQCYDCGFGHECVVGNVYPREGLCSKEQAQANRPVEYKDNKKSKEKVKAMGRLLNSILKARLK